jgi:DNA-binding protein Fis
MIVVRQECDISVSHLYKWALREVERCVLSAVLGQPKGEKKHHDTIRT